MKEADEAYDIFLRKLIGLRVDRGETGKNILGIFSTFCFIHENTAFLVTAGHVLQTNLRRFLDSEFSNELRFYLMDNFSSDAPHQHGVPFDRSLIEDFARYSSNTDVYDFGFIPLTAYYVSLLLKNKIKAMSINEIAAPGEQFERFVVVGIPDEANDLQKKGVLGKTGVVVKHFHRMAERPRNTVVNYPQDTFFGEVVMDSGLESMVGMSGGPIIGLRLEEDKYYVPKLCAIQAGWLSQKILVGCPAYLLPHYTKEFLASQE